MSPRPYARPVFLGVSAAVAAALIVAAGPIILPFLLAILVAYVLYPAVLWMNRRLRLPRWLSIIVAYVIMLGAMTGFGVVVVPRLFQEMKQLTAELPKLTSTVRDQWLPLLDQRLGRWTQPPP